MVRMFCRFNVQNGFSWIIRGENPLNLFSQIAEDFLVLTLREGTTLVRINLFVLKTF